MEKIFNEDRLFRRINFINPDFQIKDDGVPASSNFTLKKLENDAYEDGLSVDLERLITYEKAIIDSTQFRLYALVAGFVRSLGLDCINDGTPHPAHSLIIDGELLKKRSTAKKLAMHSISVNYLKKITSTNV